jgi:molybdenum cofactor cytidylyltransferase
LGEPKQQLPYRGKTLLQRAVQTALASGCAPVAVVLGANAEQLMPELANMPLVLVQNPDWQEGMASSIRAGLGELMRQQPALTQVIIMVCDQPFVEADVLKQLMQSKQESQAGIVASAYKGTVGTPVLFDQVYFPELLALQGQEGAKKIILKHQPEVSTIAFEAGAIDIDTQEDYSALLRSDPHNRKA